MNGRPEPEPALLDNWHLRMLNIEDDQDARARQSAILQQLESSSFLPNLHLDSSIQQFVTGDVSPVKKWQSCEQLLRRDVEYFSEQFFQLSVPERRRIHARLLKDAEYFPVLNRRLRHLAKGLAIDPELPPGLSGETYRLRDLLLELLTAAGHEAALIRREWQADIEQSRPAWIEAVNQLRRHSFDLTLTAPELTQWIENPPKSRRKARPVPPPGREAKGSGSSVPGWAIALVVVFAIRIIAVWARTSDETETIDSRVNIVDQLDRQRREAAQEQEQRQQQFRQMIDDLAEITNEDPDDLEREFRQFEPELDIPFQEKLKRLSHLREGDSLNVGSELFAVTRADGQLVIVFKDHVSLVSMLEVDSLWSQITEELDHRDLAKYARYTMVRDQISSVQPTVFIAESENESSEQLYPLIGTRYVDLDYRVPPRYFTTDTAEAPADSSAESLEEGPGDRQPPADDSDE